MFFFFFEIEIFKMLFILILSYIQIIYGYNITINSNNIHSRCILNNGINIISKTELMKKNKFNSNQYYCKNDSDICVFIAKFYEAPYINFPDENGNIKTYIAKSCNYENDLTQCYDGKEYTIPKTNETVFCSYRCTKDSDCLHNKCMFTNQKDSSQINTPPLNSLNKRNNITNSSVGYCVFNNNSPVIHCDDIFKYYLWGYFERSYVHCGKPYFANCTTSEECSGESCNVTCGPNVEEPSDKGPRARNIINNIIIFITIIVFIICLCCICLCYSKKYYKLLK